MLFSRFSFALRAHLDPILHSKPLQNAAWELWELLWNPFWTPKPSKKLRWRWFDGRQSHSESSGHPKVPQRSFKRLGKCHKTPSETLNKTPTAFREPSKMPQGLPKTPGIIPKSYMPKAKIPNPKSELPNSQISQSTPTS